jgi:hypothetical protein
MKKIFYVVVVGLLILPACSKPQQGEEYFPQISKGSQWEYLVKFIAPSGKVMDGRLSVSIEGKDDINGKKYFKQVSLISGLPGAKPQIGYSRRTEQGIFRIEGTSKDTQEYLATPFPLTVGNSWTVKSQDGQILYLAESISGIKIMNREYTNSLKISFNGEKKGQHIEGYSYFAANVGEIMTNMKVGDVIIQYILDKYKIEH